MDVTFILVIGLSAVVASSWMVLIVVTSRQASLLRVPFAVAYLMGLAVMQPWRIASAQEAAIAAVTLVFMLLWVATGWLIGAGPTALLLAIARRVIGRFRARG